MNYRLKIKALAEQVPEIFDWEFFDACKTQNRKVFPFYCHVSLCCSQCINGEKVILPRIPYDDYPGNIDDDTRYWGWVVWEDFRTVKFYKCNPGNYYDRLYTYHEQVHGWAEPIAFNKKFENSIPHRAVWFIVIGSHSSNSYFLNEYKNTGISEAIYSKNFKEIFHGGSHWGEEIDRGSFQYSASEGLELRMDLFEEPILKLSHTAIINIINEILYENAEHQQLSLF